MAIFGIKLNQNDLTDSFVYKMKEKLEKPDIFQNPFKGFIRAMGKANNYFLFIYLDLIWINPLPVAIILTGVLYLAHGFNFHWTHLFLIPLWLGAFMFTTTFSKWAMYFTLRKHGYKDKIKFMSDTDLLLRLAKWDKVR